MAADNWSDPKHAIMADLEAWGTHMPSQPTHVWLPFEPEAIPWPEDPDGRNQVIEDWAARHGNP